VDTDTVNKIVGEFEYSMKELFGINNVPEEKLL
jgi:hypothetical protein